MLSVNSCNSHVFHENNQNRLSQALCDTHSQLLAEIVSCIFFFPLETVIAAVINKTQYFYKDSIVIFSFQGSKSETT